MKKIILLAALTVASLTASAQVYMGGSVGLNRNTTDNETEFTIAPEVGYEFNSTWAAGAAIGYNYNYNDGLKTNVFIVKPYARYTYFRSSNNFVSLFVDGGVDLGFGKSKYEDYSSKTVFIYGIGFKPGISLKVSEKFSIDAHLGFLGFQGCNHAAEEADYTQSFGFDFSSMNLNFGFYYTF